MWNKKMAMVLAVSLAAVVLASGATASATGLDATGSEDGTMAPMALPEDPYFVTDDDGVLVEFTMPRGSGEVITIPEGVTGIGDSVFCRRSIGAIDIPDSVRSIGDSAFDGCELSRSDPFQIPDGVESIGKRAFAYTSGLSEQIVIPDSVKSIGERAFMCSEFHQVILSNGIEEIPDFMCNDAHWLLSMIIPYGVTRIGDYAFSDCDKLTEVAIPGSVTEIGDGAFEWTALRKVVIPDSVTEIGKGAFTGIEDLTICGSRGSAAEAYAEKYGIDFEPIG